jgi:hypothetical protein
MAIKGAPPHLAHDNTYAPDSRKAPGDRGRGFPVTIREEIGWVDLDGDGEHNPAEAAMLIIARCQRDGLYEFPGPDENTTTRVQVQWTAPD